MRDSQARTTYLKDYRPPPFTIETTDLEFNLYEDYVLVVAKLLIKTNDGSDEPAPNALTLQGHELELRSLLVNGRSLESDQFLLDDDSITIPGLSDLLEKPQQQFIVEIHTRIEPQKNTALEGLYKSKKIFCTQCEAEGFRRITYYLDRPDVMSRFTTTIRAEREKYPVLLSNGNNINSGIDEKNPDRHWVTWEDPFKKPSYLFALVAGDLVSLDDTFVTCSGQKVKLQIFVEEKDLDKCDHAMLSLKNAMAWDEEVYGREYDLEVYMIVAVDDFNMGAMENKGLNIFNTSCVLANPSTTSDSAFQRVEGVVAHEYFHNWSGNRVTCRDWFQLSLKEGFTVFRDSEFSADMGSRTVKRVEDVNFLKTVQFAEDAGPMAHSVRPDSYMEISNFYTVTVYEKGAEVVRMLSLILGQENFRKGTDLYFNRHDGQAVTTEDFVKAMEDASGIDLSQFRRWYSQAGTPVLNIIGNYEADKKQYSLKVQQSCPDTPGQNNKLPFSIPLRMGLLDKNGLDLPLRLKDEKVAESTDRVLTVNQETQHFLFLDVPERPVPSLSRSFSAPVRLDFDYSREDLYFLMIHDSDGFNRWNAAQLLASDIIRELQDCAASNSLLIVPPLLINAYSGVLDAVLKPNELDKAMIAHLLALPTEGSLIEQVEIANVDSIYAAREFIANALGKELEGRFAAVFEANTSDNPFKTDSGSIAQRALKNLALAYLVRIGSDYWVECCFRQFEEATNMTDQMAALRCLVNSDSKLAIDLANASLKAFYDKWKGEPLVVDQWFMVQASCQREGTLSRVKELLQHEAFEIRNPNKVLSLIRAFCGQNYIGFHHASGEGYEFLADRVLEINKFNPQIAARLLVPLTRWKKFDARRQAMMQTQLLRIKAESNLSKDVFEVVDKSTIS